MYSTYSKLFITNLLYARPMKTITVCASYKLVFIVGIIVILLFVITVCYSIFLLYKVSSFVKMF